MPIYTGDYLRDTQHLSCSEHGIYFKLLMYCWDQKGPAPLDERRLCGIVNARSGDEIEALRRVLAEFFVRMEDGFYNRRMQKEVERASTISLARSAAGAKGYEARAKQLPSNCLASASTPTPTTTTTTTTKKTNTALAAPSGVSNDVWDDWLALRKAKRAAVTQTALRGIQLEAEKAGLTLEEALRTSCERGWAGFRAEWVERKYDADAVSAIVMRQLEAEGRG